MRCLACIFLSLLLCSSSPVNAKEEDARGMLDSLKESYDSLPDAGKFATGAVAGFGATRFTVNKVVTVVKLAGAAFIGYVKHDKCDKCFDGIDTRHTNQYPLISSHPLITLS